MLDFRYKNSTEIIFGRDIEKDIGSVTSKYGKKILLHYGGGSIKKSGLYDVVINSLKELGLEVFVLGGVQANPRVSLVREGIDLCRREKIDAILAVGGGSVIDSAKAIGFGTFLDGDIWDCYEGKTTPTQMLPVICVLTIPAAGSESSSHSVLTNEDGWVKKGVGADCLRPKVAFMNPERTMTLPDYQTACGASDMLAHVMERYFTHTKDVSFTDGLCEASMKSIMKLSLDVLKNPQSYGSRAELMWAGTVAHNGSLDLGRLTDWASHAIEHELSAIYDIAHGAGLSIIFPAWMRYVSKEPENQPKLLAFATRVFNIEADFDYPEKTIEQGILALENYYQIINMPIRLTQVDIDEKHLDEMASKATGNGQFTLGNFQKLGIEDVKKIYRLAYK